MKGKKIHGKGFTHQLDSIQDLKFMLSYSTVFSGGAGGARAPPEFGGSQKIQICLSEFSYYYEHPRIWKAKYGAAN